MPPKRERDTDVRRALDRLASLKIDPPARARLAAELIAASSRPDVLMPAAQALLDHPLPEGREALLSAYARLAAESRKLDSGGALRALLVRALRPVAGREDIAFLESAASTYEASVQGPGAVELRAAALVALTDVAPEVSALHAARILAEADDPGRTQQGTGEPAVTAARVLGALGHTVALYAVAQMAWRPPDEVIAECLRQLGELPGDAAAALVGRFAARNGDLVQLGLVDLCVESEGLGREQAEPISRWLRGAEQDIYRYALMAFVASRRTPLHEVVAGLVAGETKRERLAVAAEALALARGVAILEEARKTVEERLAAGSGRDISARVNAR
jgi:hypothetical protein